MLRISEQILAVTAETNCNSRMLQDERAQRASLISEIQSKSHLAYHVQESKGLATFVKRRDILANAFDQLIDCSLAWLITQCGSTF